VVATRIAVRLTPRAGVDSLDPPDGNGEVRARVRAAPVEGAANEALLRLLASTLDVPRSWVRLVTGGHGRRKVVEVESLDHDEVRRRLAGGGRH
jgi:uncharacterized protein YggU (UPF0235/DUF167 family)